MDSIAVEQPTGEQPKMETVKKPEYKKLGITVKEAEKAILGMQDLVMKLAQYYGLHNYGVADCLRQFGELKNGLKYKIEDALNYPIMKENGLPSKKPDGTNMAKLNLESGKKYQF
jgi:hypothetical protein